MFCVYAKCLNIYTPSNPAAACVCTQTHAYTHECRFVYTHPSNSTAARLLMHVYTYICAYMHGCICICVHTHHPSNLTAAAARCSCHRCRQRRARRIVEYTCRFTTDRAAPARAESILRTCSHAHTKESQHIWGSHSTYIQKSNVYTQESLVCIPTSPLVHEPSSAHTAHLQSGYMQEII